MTLQVGRARAPARSRAALIGAAAIALVVSGAVAIGHRHDKHARIAGVYSGLMLPADLAPVLDLIAGEK